MRGFIRTWHDFDLNDIGKYLIVVGEVSSECFACHTIGIPSSTKQCPQCGITFRYMGFRRQLTTHYIAKVRAESPYLTLIDFDDFKRGVGKSEARKLLDI